MADYTKYTKQEMQAYAIAKNIKENQIVIVGTGLPLLPPHRGERPDGLLPCGGPPFCGR